MQAVVDQFAVRLPPGAKIDWPFDQSPNISQRLEHLGRDMAIAVLIVLLTLLPLGLRLSLIVMLSIPFSLVPAALAGEPASPGSALQGQCPG